MLSKVNKHMLRAPSFLSKNPGYDLTTGNYQGFSGHLFLKNAATQEISTLSAIRRKGKVQDG